VDFTARAVLDAVWHLHTFAGPGSVEVADAAFADLADNEGTGDSLAVQVVGTPKTTASIARAALTPWKAGMAVIP
jgi:hypothetical protein